MGSYRGCGLFRFYRSECPRDRRRTSRIGSRYDELKNKNVDSYIHICIFRYLCLYSYIYVYTYICIYIKGLEEILADSRQKDRDSWIKRNEKLKNKDVDKDGGKVWLGTIHKAKVWIWICMNIHVYLNTHIPTIAHNVNIIHKHIFRVLNGRLYFF
jgi:hypothetical protein